MATAPSVKSAEDQGSARPSPPIRSMSRVPVAWTTTPADRKSSALKMAWFQTWSTAAASPSTTRTCAMGRASDDGEADAHHDDPDVLDAVIREEPLDVVLRDGERDAADAAHRPEHEQEDAPGHRRVRQHREHADDPVDADLDDDARHQRGDVARRARVGGRQPDVKRHDAGLDAEGHEDEQEQHAPRPGPDAVRRDGHQVERPGERGERRERRDEQDEAHVRCGQVHPARLAHVGPLILGRHQKERGHGHHLERHQEQHGVSRDEERGHRPGQESRGTPGRAPRSRDASARTSSRSRRARRGRGPRAWGTERPR